MRKRTLIIIFFFLLLFLSLSKDVEAKDCWCDNISPSEAEDKGYTRDPGACDPKCAYDQFCYCKSSTVSIPVEGDKWLTKNLFGSESITLKILTPTKFVSGETTIWVIIAMIISNLFVALFLVTIVAIVIGVLKWFASQGQEGKIESGQKWIRNAIMGFVATIVAFVLVNVGTYFIGVGNVFDLADNVSVCGDDVLYRYKQDKNLLDKDVECKCSNDVWVCK